MFDKNLCDEVSKIKNLRCTFSLFFRADRHEIILRYHILLFLAGKWLRKWSLFMMYFFLKISQYILHKSEFKKMFLKKIKVLG